MKDLPGFGLTVSSLVLSLLATPALAAYKCIDARGRVSYQAKPCPEDSRGGDMSLNVNRSFSGRSSAPVMDPYVLGIDFVSGPPLIQPASPAPAPAPSASPAPSAPSPGTTNP